MGARNEGLPSRTHSPSAMLGHHQGPAGGSSGIHLPPPHGLAPFNTRNPLSSPRAPSPLREGTLGGLSSQIPTISELEQHYYLLQEQKRKTLELLDRTEQMMDGVRFGIEQLRDSGAAPGSGGSLSEGTAAVPLASRASGDRRESSNVWPIHDGRD